MVEDSYELEKALTEGLNEGQKKAFDEIVDFFLENTHSEAFVLMGYAGTGKTFLVKRLVQWINATQKKNRIAITAPTNKAVRVLYSMGSFEEKEVKHYGSDIFDSLKDTTSSINYSTIHKLLGLKEKITAKGEQIFTAQGNIKNDLDQYNYLIVDECSMLNDSLCKDVMKACNKVKILFMGDPAQIPPVKRKDCIPFREDHGYNFGRATLSEIMRQKGDHPVVDASFLIRNNLSLAQPIPTLATKLNENDHGIIYLNSTDDRSEVRPLLNQYFNCSEFREDANYAKIIAWTNKVVNYMNTVVRELMYGEEIPAFVVGEKLVVSKPIFAEYSGIIFNTSEELAVIEVKTKEKTLSRGQYKMKAKLYDLKVEAYDPGSKLKIKRNIEVMHEDSMIEYKALVSQAFTTARATSGHAAKTLWRAYFDLLKWSADVAYNYAITAHKAQGSSYTNVVLMEENLDKNPNTVERNRIKYTSYSRPTDRLFIVRENYE
jgi:AAA domain